MTNILYGKPVAEKINSQTKEIIRKSQLSPKLCIVLSKEDQSAVAYTQMLQKKADSLGIIAKIVLLPDEITQEEANKTIDSLSKDPDVNGVIIQSPINNLDIDLLRSYLDPFKDVDGSTETNLGKLVKNKHIFAPATAQAVIEMLLHYKVVMSGKNIVVIGRSTIVGKPLAHLLLAQDATVTICHSKTSDTLAHTQNADIIISAAGRPNLVTADMVKQDAIVIDVGTNFVNGKMVGDVDFEKVQKVTSNISPVPGGIGPVTTAVLLQHVVRSTELNQEIV